MLIRPRHSHRDPVSWLFYDVVYSDSIAHRRCRLMDHMSVRDAHPITLSKFLSPFLVRRIVLFPSVSITSAVFHCRLRLMEGDAELAEPKASS